MIQIHRVVGVLSSAAFVVMSQSAEAGPAGGVTSGQMTELLGEVAFYCGSGPDGQGGPDLGLPCDPATSSIGPSETIVNSSCGSSSNVCVPNVVREAQGTLTVTAREIVVDANPACSPIPFDGCEIRIETEVRLEDLGGTPIIDMGATGDTFQSPVFVRESDCPQGNGDNSADGLRIAEWFPFSAKECVVNPSIDFGGALIPDARNFPILGSAFEANLLQFAQTIWGIDPGGVAPLSLVPAGTRAGKPEFTLRTSSSSPEQNALVGTYPVTMRFAQRRTSLVTIAAQDTPGYSFGVATNGSLVYVADSSSGLRITDVSDATAPVELGASERNRFSQADDVELVGNRAYLLDRTGGLAIIDVADAANPVEIGFFAKTYDYADDVEVAGSFAYIAAVDSGLRIVDVADPTSPVEIGVFGTPPPGFAIDVELAGSLAYLADFYGVRVIDIANPVSPVEVGFIGTPGNSRDVDLVGGFAYVTDGSSMRVVDIADPTSPVEIGFFATTGFARQVSVDGSLAFVVEDTSLVRIIDVTDPTNPVEAALLDTLGYVTDLEAVGGIAYVTHENTGVHLIDVADPTVPIEVGFFDSPGYAHGVAVAGSLVYVADTFDGLRIVDVSNPNDPIEVGYLEPDDARDVEVDGSLVYLADRHSGLRIIDVTSPITPIEVGALDTPGTAENVELADGLAYVADGYSGVRIIDVADPTNPIEIGLFDSPGYAYDAKLAGSALFVADYWSLRVIDITDPTSPIEIGSLSTPGFPANIGLAGSLAYVTEDRLGLRVIDITDPTDPVEFGFFNNSFGLANGCVEAVGELAYVGDRSGLRIIDVADPANPAASDLLLTPRPMHDLEIAGSLAYSAIGEQGIRLIGFAPEPDPDLDGLPTSLEVTLCTNPDDRDTDEDGISDGEEDVNLNGILDPGELDPCNADSDGDGVQDGTEIGMTTGTPDVDGVGPVLATDSGIFIPDADPRTTTDPLNPDTDGDGMADGVEDANGNGQVDPGEIDPNANVGSDRVVTLRFSGTYDTNLTGGSTVFGESGSSVPYQYEIVYDTALDTNSEFFAAGASMNTQTTTHQWYGYSASGIVSASLTFGSKTFPVSSISARLPEGGHSADLWFDTDLKLDVPTRSWIYFHDADGLLELGGGACGLLNCYMTSESVIEDKRLMGEPPEEGGSGAGSMSIAELGTILPGPGWLIVPAILLSGIAGLSGRRPRSFYTRIAAHFGGRARR